MKTCNKLRTVFSDSTINVQNYASGSGCDLAHHINGGRAADGPSTFAAIFTALSSLIELHLRRVQSRPWLPYNCVKLCVYYTASTSVCQELFLHS